jgi:hypothetical protein
MTTFLIIWDSNLKFQIGFNVSKFIFKWILQKVNFKLTQNFNETINIFPNVFWESNPEDTSFFNTS